MKKDITRLQLTFLSLSREVKYIVDAINDEFDQSKDTENCLYCELCKVKKKVESGPGSEESIPDLTSSKSSLLDQIRILNIGMVIMLAFMHFCML
jgi:hypothetical protein